VSLTWGGIKRLVRLQAVAEQLALVARDGQTLEVLPSTGRDLVIKLIDETRVVLRDADADLAGEFERIVAGHTDQRLPLAIPAGMLAGWLGGVVEAETLEVQIRTGGGERRPAGRSSTRHNGG
jgi:hypothetical protein